MNIKFENYFDFEALNAFSENLKSQQNYYINYLNFFINNHYESIINNVNFFHYATESMIWEIKLKANMYVNTEESIEESSDSLKNLSINQCNFYNNIKLLTGSSNSYEAKLKLSELQLAKIFYEKFEIIRKKIFVTDEEIENFETIFRKISLMTVSACLVTLLVIINIFYKDINDEMLFYNIFLEFDQLDNKTLGKFLKLFENKLNFKIERNSILMIFIKYYYYYTKTKYEDYIHDLDLFFNHSNSLIEKVKNISSRNYDAINRKIIKSRTYENLSNFYTILHERVCCTTYFIQNKIIELKIWVNESILNYPKFFYESFNFSKIMLYERIVSPSKDFMVLYTDKSITFLLTNLTNAEKIMKEFFTDKMEIFIDTFEKQINEKDLFFRFDYDDNINYIKIDIDNNVLILNPKKFKEYIGQIYEKMKYISNNIYEESKAYVMDKYKSFLGDLECNEKK